MTLDLEDRLWEQLEAAAERDAARGSIARAATAARGALPRWRPLDVVVVLAATAAVVALVVALAPDRAKPGWHTERVEVAGGRLSAGVAGHGALWSYDERSGTVLRLDPATHRVIARIPLPPAATGVTLASGDDAVWAVPSTPIRHSSPAAANPRPVELARIDPDTNRVAARVLLRAPDGRTVVPVGVVTLPDAVWVWGEGGALRVDPARNRVTAAIAVPGEKVMGFAATEERISFATDYGQIVSFDARTGARLGAIPFDAPVNSQKLVAAGGGIVVYRLGGTLASMDPVSGRDLWTAQLGTQPRDVAVAGGRLWVLLAGAESSELRALDPGDGHVVTRVSLPANDAGSLAPAGAAPLVTTQSGTLIAVRP